MKKKQEYKLNKPTNDIMRIYLDTTVEELHVNGLITVRTYNSLRYSGLNTLEDLLDFEASPLDLLKL